MPASVLFDAPGPKTIARHRLYTVIASLGLLAVVAAVIGQLARKGQFAYALWEPFVTPNIMQLIAEAAGKTLQAAVFAIIGALLLGVVLGAGKLSDHLVVRWPAWLFVEFFRAVPLLLVIIATWFAIGARPGRNAFLRPGRRPDPVQRRGVRRDLPRGHQRRRQRASPRRPTPSACARPWSCASS